MLNLLLINYLRFLNYFNIFPLCFSTIVKVFEVWTASITVGKLFSEIKTYETASSML